MATAGDLRNVAPPYLGALRGEIDRLDEEIVSLVGRRLGLAAATLEVKRRHAMAATDSRREAEVVRRVAVLAREQGLDAELVREILWRLIELSRTRLSEIARRPVTR